MLVSPTMKYARPFLLAFAVAAALVAAGCGGGDDSSETTIADTPTTGAASGLSKDEYIQQGDAICAEVNAAVGAVDASATDEADRLGQTADLYEGMIERLRGLGTPDDDAGLDDMLTAGDDLVQATRDAELAAQRGDDSSLAEAEVSSNLENFQAEAGDYGFDDCAAEGALVVPGTPGAEPAAPVTPTEPVTPTAPVVPTEPVTPAPAPAPTPAPPPPPTGGAGSGGGGTGGGSGGSGGSGGVGPG